VYVLLACSLPLPYGVTFAVEDATDETALLLQQDGGAIPGVAAHPNGGPQAAEALLTAIENATAGGGLHTNRRARMLGVPRIYGGGKQQQQQQQQQLAGGAGGGGSDATPPPAVNTGWSIEQWSKCELWYVRAPVTTTWRLW
jgi:hypothetical protein